MEFTNSQKYHLSAGEDLGRKMMWVTDHEYEVDIGEDDNDNHMLTKMTMMMMFISL